MIDPRPLAHTSGAIRRHRVVVVDADHRVRESLACLLGLGECLEVVGQAGQVGDALRVCEETRPDVVVVDPRLPEVDAGVGLISMLRRRRPDIRVLVLAWGIAQEHLVLASGADALLPKSLAPAELVERVAELAETPLERCRKEAVR